MPNVTSPPRTRRPSQWKRIEIPATLYRELEQEAAIVHMSTQAYAAYVLTKGIAAAKALAEVPMRDRQAAGETTVRSRTVQPSKTHTSVTDAARITGQTPETILAAIDSGELAALPAMSEWVIDRQDLKTWSEQQPTP